MTKQEIINQLKKLKIEFDQKELKAKLESRLKRVLKKAEKEKEATKKERKPKPKFETYYNGKLVLKEGTTSSLGNDKVVYLIDGTVEICTLAEYKARTEKKIKK